MEPPTVAEKRLMRSETAPPHHQAPRVGTSPANRVYYAGVKHTAGSRAVLAAAGLGTALATASSSPGHTSRAQVPLGRCSGGAAPAVAFSVPLPGKPGQMLLSKGTLWVAIEPARWGRSGRLLALDPGSGRVGRTIRLPVSPMRFVTGFGSLWLTGAGGGRRYSGILRLDPRSGRVLRVIRGAHPLGSALAATKRAIWVAGADTFPKGHPERSGVYFVYKIDPRRGAVVGRVRLRSTVIDLVGDGPASGPRAGLRCRSSHKRAESSFASRSPARAGRSPLQAREYGSHTPSTGAAETGNRRRRVSCIGFGSSLSHNSRGSRSRSRRGRCRPPQASPGSRPGGPCTRCSGSTTRELRRQPLFRSQGPCGASRPRRGALGSRS